MVCSRRKVTGGFWFVREVSGVQLKESDRRDFGL